MPRRPRTATVSHHFSSAPLVATLETQQGKKRKRNVNRTRKKSSEGKKQQEGHNLVIVRGPSSSSAPQAAQSSKKQQDKEKSVKRRRCSINRGVALSSAIALDKTLLGAFQDFSTALESFDTILNPKAWFPKVLHIRPTRRPSSHVFSFNAELESIDLGVQLLRQSAQEISSLGWPGSISELPVDGKPKKAKEVSKAVGKKNQPLVSPHFPTPEDEVNAHIKTSPKKPRSPAKTTSKISHHFETDPFSNPSTPEGLSFKLKVSNYGLIQERIRGSLYALVVQAILWNQTKGKDARPILFKLLSTYPTPESLSQASPIAVQGIIHCLGLQKIRSERLVKLAQAWVTAPPHPSRRYGKRNYPRSGDNLDVRDGELLDSDDGRVGWEIAHLPGIGAYALDSYRIFYRDTLRGLDKEDWNEPEWKKVLPLDKDLRPYLVWRWEREGWRWDPETGEKSRIQEVKK